MLLKQIMDNEGREGEKNNVAKSKISAKQLLGVPQLFKASTGKMVTRFEPQKCYRHVGFTEFNN